MRAFILVCLMFGMAAALNCYQGQQNASMPLQGSAIMCPTVSLSCIKTYDNASNIVSRNCQTTNCTLNGAISPTGFCQNTSAYPYQTYCCCYTDGCNSALGLGTLTALTLTIGFYLAL